MKFLFYFSISVLNGHETSVLACIFNKHASQARCRVCAAGGGAPRDPLSTQGSTSVSPTDAPSLGLTAQRHGPGRACCSSRTQRSKGELHLALCPPPLIASVSGDERQGGGEGSLGEIWGTQVSPSASGGPVVKVAFPGAARSHCTAEPAARLPHPCGRKLEPWFIR